MGTGKVSFEKITVQINLAGNKVGFLEKLSGSSVRNNLSIGQGGRGPLLSILKEAGKRDLFIYTSTEGNLTERLPMQAIKEFLVSTVFQELYTALYDGWYTFPTERTTYITLPWNFSSLRDDLRIAGETFQQGQRTKSLQWPVFHFLYEFVRELYNSKFSVREREANLNSSLENFIKLAQLLEEQVLQGGLDFSTPEPDPLREILFKPGEGVTLERSFSCKKLRHSSEKKMCQCILSIRVLLKVLLARMVSFTGIRSAISLIE